MMVHVGKEARKAMDSAKKLVIEESKQKRVRKKNKRPLTKEEELLRRKDFWVKDDLGDQGVIWCNGYGNYYLLELRPKKGLKEVKVNILTSEEFEERNRKLSERKAKDVRRLKREKDKPIESSRSRTRSLVRGKSKDSVRNGRKLVKKHRKLEKVSVRKGGKGKKSLSGIKCTKVVKGKRDAGYLIEIDVSLLAEEAIIEKLKSK